MKKLILVAAVFCIALVSCEKDYSCSCTETESYPGGKETYTYSFKVEGATKTEATAACNEATIVYSDEDYSSKTQCKLSK